MLWRVSSIARLTGREVKRTIGSPDHRLTGQGSRQVLLRRFDDPVLQQPMLLCMVIEDDPNELVVVTVYKASKLDKYLERGAS